VANNGRLIALQSHLGIQDEVDLALVAGIETLAQDAVLQVVGIDTQYVREPARQGGEWFVERQP
jgi:hypothetical protein